jgi:hypothetical protein
MSKFAFVGVVALLVASCNGGGGTTPAQDAAPSITASATPSTPLPDPCVLLSRAEVGAVVGKPVVTWTPSPSVPGRQCSWLLDNNDGASWVMTLTVHEPQHYDDARADSAKDRPGPGERAYEEEEGGLVTIGFLAGRYGAYLTNGIAPGVDRVALARYAELVAKRLAA